MTIKPELHARVIAALERGDDKSLRTIAEEVGNVSRATIRKIAREIGHIVPSQKMAMKRLHANPAFAAKHSAASSERMKKLNADPAFATKHSAASSERIKRLNADPAFTAKHAAASSEHMKKRHAARRLLKTMGVPVGNSPNAPPTPEAILPLPRSQLTPGAPARNSP